MKLQAMSHLQSMPDITFRVGFGGEVDFFNWHTYYFCSILISKDYVQKHWAEMLNKYWRQKQNCLVCWHTNVFHWIFFHHFGSRTRSSRPRWLEWSISENLVGISGIFSFLNSWISPLKNRNEKLKSCWKNRQQ